MFKAKRLSQIVMSTLGFVCDWQYAELGYQFSMICLL
jgi:hypothetical protein